MARGDRMSHLDELWAAIVTTDRPAAMAALGQDLALQARSAGLQLTILVVENSAQPASRELNLRTAARLREDGVSVVLDDSAAPGASTAEARLRLRELARGLTDRPRPGFVWALDDDVRLQHLVWTGDHLEPRALHNHVRFLADLRATAPNLDVLVGEVTGDPPVPAVATLASTLGDVEANLSRMFGSDPSSRWRVDPASLEALREPDAYYDFSVERPRPPWESPVTWLPRTERATVARACRELLEEVAWVPLGAAATRPILADPARFTTLADSTRRGANAVFFDPDAFLEHDYPSVTLAGIQTRRSDMIGARRLAWRRPGRVRSSGFSVLHRRPRTDRWPGAEDTRRTLLEDTLGALLAREVEACRAGCAGSPGFLSARVERIEAAVVALSEKLTRLERLLERPPGWVSATMDLTPLRDVLSWSRECVPGAVEGRLGRRVVETLTSPEVLRALRARAAELAGVAS